YEDSTAVLGPLSRSSEPHAYDLCRGHASSLTAPRGSQLLRVPGSTDVSHDLVALSDAVDPRRRPPAPETPAAPAPPHRPAERQRPGDGRQLHVLRCSNACPPDRGPLPDRDGQ